MKSDFISIIEKYSDAQTADSMWNEAMEMYAGENRFYHTADHLENFYSQLLKCKNEVRDWESVVVALLYHDSIYGMPDRRDEEGSAELAGERLSATRFPPEKIRRVNQLILATKKHERSDDPDVNIFNDADMSIVGLEREYYKQYAANIRKEYAQVPGYNFGRRMVLEYFLKMAEIFKTRFFYNLYEETARENIRWELSTL